MLPGNHLLYIYQSSPLSLQEMLKAFPESPYIKYSYFTALKY